MKSLRAALLAVATVVAAVLALTACSSSGTGDSTYHYDGAQAVGNRAAAAGETA